MTIEQIIGKYDEAIMEAHADLMRNELNVAQIKALRENLELFKAGRDALREQQESENTQAKMTNADRIRAMSDEKLAATMMCPNEMGMADIPCDHSDQKNCCKCLLDWLRQPEATNAES